MEESLETLSRDPHFAPLITQYGKPVLARGKTPFQALTRAIIFQQLSGKAASSIYARFVALYGITVRTPIDWESHAARRFPMPRDVLMTRDDLLRTAGLSMQKIRYIKDLAQKFDDGTIPHRRLHRMTNEDIIDILTDVHGIGVWTVQMFLIFTLHRLDVLPVDDLGIRKGFRSLYDMKSLPSKRTMERLARPWRQHASIASWYLWRVSDDA